MLNFHHLGLFHAVVTTGNISSAAERLTISQPAVSKQLKQLETAVGVPLLERHAKGVRPTAAGSVLAACADRIFVLAAEAERAVSDLRHVRRGRLAVGGSPTVGVYLLRKAIVAFGRAHPAVELRIETQSVDVLKARLLDGMIDFAISETVVTNDRLESTRLFDDVLVPIAAKSTGAMSAAAFCRQPFVTRQTDGPPSLVERTLAARGFAIQSALSVSSTEAIKQAVIAGVGVAMVSRMAVSAEIAAGLLVRVPVPGLSIRYPIHVVRRRSFKPSPTDLAFVRFVADLAKHD